MGHAQQGARGTREQGNACEGNAGTRELRAGMGSESCCGEAGPARNQMWSSPGPMYLLPSVSSHRCCVPAAPLNTGGSSKRSMSASHGGSLSYDSEGEPPTSGKSKRSRHSSVKGVGRSMSPMSGELPDLNFLPRRASSKSDMIDYFASDDFQAGILAQSQLLEDTGGSTQKGMPADSINTTTIVVAKLLRDHFNKLKTADISEASIFNLASRLDRTQAARMFYQICVLASNESITVKQAEPYGDILLKRGVTL